MLDIAMSESDAFFPKGAGSKIYKSMYNDTISKNISGGFGYSKLLFNFLVEKQNKTI
jgi:Rod binding domain-containing protein